jgi:glycosyltransferase involved in cell wall biosynthesis
LIFFVFSYNRGPHLKNCVESIETCAPDHRIIVYDDASNDPETKNILSDIETRHEVRQRDDKGSGDQHGALYTNMQRAIKSVEEDCLICFLQDDTQVVRPILERETRFWSQLFADNPSLGFIQPCFTLATTEQRRPFRVPETDNSRLLYREDRGQSAGIHYSDLLITSPTRPMAWESEEIMENTPMSWKISSAAMVSRRMRDSAKATSSGMAGSR